jgi:hypothetical protein
MKAHPANTTTSSSNERHAPTSGGSGASSSSSGPDPAHMRDADQVVQTSPGGVAQATAALQLQELQQAVLNTANYVSLAVTAFNAKGFSLQMGGALAWAAGSWHASFDSLADLYLLLLMRLAWLMQPQQQQLDAQRQNSRSSSRSSSSSSKQPQIQQPVPCWHEQFLAAAGAAAWDASGGSSPPWQGVADLREATDDVLGALVHVAVGFDARQSNSSSSSSSSNRRQQHRPESKLPCSDALLLLLEVMLLEAAHEQPQGNIMRNCSVRMSSVLQFVLRPGSAAFASGASHRDAVGRADTAVQSAASMLLPHVLHLLGPRMLALAAKSGSSSSSSRQDSGSSNVLALVLVLMPVMLLMLLLMA